MIIPLEISAKNFCGIGNKEIKVRIENGITMMIGENGSGKSTMFDILFFNLTGSPYRQIKVLSLVNRQNKKNCETSFSFLKDEEEYTIERGIKPNYVRIIDKKNKYKHITGVKEANKVISEIIGMTENEIRQILIFSDDYFKPYLSLTPEKKREYIHKFFSVEIYAMMNSLHKMESKDMDKIIESKTTVLENKQTLVKEFKEANDDYLTNKRFKISEELEGKINLKNNEAEKNEAKISELKDKIVKLFKTNNIKHTEDYKQDILTHMSKDRNILSSYEKDLVHYEDNAKKHEKALNRLKEIDEQLLEFPDISKTLNPILEFYKNIFYFYNTMANNLHKKLSNKKNEIYNLTAVHETQLKSLQTIRDNFPKSNKCPYCNSKLTKEHVKQQIALTNNQIYELNKSHNEKTTLIENEIKDINSEYKRFCELEDKAKNNNNKINDIKKQKEELLQEHDTISGYTMGASKIKKESIEKEITKYKKKVKDNDKIYEAFNELYKELVIYKDKEDVIENEMAVLLNDYNNHNSTCKKMKAKLNEMRNAVIKFKSDLNKYDKEKETMELVKIILGDDGIKKFIIAQYTPTLNELFKKYLNYFKLKVNLFMDSNAMSIEVLDKNGLDAEFHSFSGGERDNISLVILLSFIELSILKNGNNFNMMCLDEITSSFDSQNVLSLLKLLKDTYTDYKILITNHNEFSEDIKVDIANYVDRTYVFKNNQNGISFNTK